MNGYAPGWCRGLPATALTVLAGRAAPDSAWRADPAWRELLRVVSLRLSPAASRQYLRVCGVDPARFDQLVDLAHGHPLGLSLLADVDVRGGEAAADPLTRTWCARCSAGLSRSSPVTSIAMRWRCARSQG